MIFVTFACCGLLFAVELLFVVDVKFSESGFDDGRVGGAALTMEQGRVGGDRMLGAVGAMQQRKLAPALAAVAVALPRAARQAETCVPHNAASLLRQRRYGRGRVERRAKQKEKKHTYSKTLSHSKHEQQNKRPLLLYKRKKFKQRSLFQICFRVGVLFCFLLLAGKNFNLEMFQFIIQSERQKMHTT